MAKKQVVSDEQLAFFDLPAGADFALEKEVYEATGKRSVRDDDPRLLRCRRDFLDDWIDYFPDGECARQRALNEAMAIHE